jgi:Methyltransferase domain
MVRLNEQGDLKMMEICRVCSSTTKFTFTVDLLGVPARYFDCSNCGYVQTETPFWLEQAYGQPIGDADTGIMLRNRANVARVAVALLAFGRLRGRVLDVGGGFGILVRMLRDLGIDARWRDKYCQNLLSKGFEDDNGSYDLATAFEVVEHLEHPLEELRSLITAFPAVLISTELAPPVGTLNASWWYLVPEYGQHIGFFRESTLAWIASELGCHYATDGASVHIFVRNSSHARNWSMLRRLTPIAARLAQVSVVSRTVADFEVARKRMQASLSNQHKEG